MTYEEWAASRGFNTALLREAWQASRQQALSEAVKVCERIEEENWKAYKGRTDPVQKDRLYNPHTEGCSDGATECASAIRSLTTTGDKA